MITPLAPVNGEAVLPLADARVHLKLTADDAAYDDQVIAARDDAIGLIETHTRKALQSRQFSWAPGRFSLNMRPPIGPISSIDAIAYVGPDGAPTSLQVGSWTLSNAFLVAATGAWPIGGSSVEVTLTAGYPDQEAIPLPLLAAVKLAMSAMFADRSNPDLSSALRMADRFRRRVL